METCMFLCFHVNLSTKTRTFPCPDNKRSRDETESQRPTNPVCLVLGSLETNSGRHECTLEQRSLLCIDTCHTATRV